MSHAVHPHVRGEVGVLFGFLHPEVGSPPRAWGSLPFPLPGQGITRFTPTCVGKSTRGNGFGDLNHGSPPRAWGSRSIRSTNVIFFRFTPTCVGKSFPTMIPVSYAAGSPPRAWGSLFCFCSCFCSCGSPPRAWGSRGRGVVRWAEQRFTPTCVGKSRSRSAMHHKRSVHPHVRGEVHRAVGWGGPRSGSPPRAWGSRSFGCQLLAKHRFTPTCVGKSVVSAFFRREVSVHPHVRGEVAFAA